MENVSKSDLRKAMKVRRNMVSPEERKAYSIALGAALLAREDVRKAIENKGLFAVYMASPAEIDLSAFVEALWASGCAVALPAWQGGTYKLTGYAPGTKLVPGPMNIPQPETEGEGSAVLMEADISVWIVPGLAFSRTGARLGYGGGWYDRFLAKAAPGSIALGVAYPFQIVDKLPLEPHDLPLDGVVCAAWGAADDVLV